MDTTASVTPAPRNIESSAAISTRGPTPGMLKNSSQPNRSVSVATRPSAVTAVETRMKPITAIGRSPAQRISSGAAPRAASRPIGAGAKT